MASLQLRRSNRLKETNKRGLKDTSIWDDTSDEEDPVPKRGPKRRKTAKSSAETQTRKHVTTRRKGKLSHLPEMPLDILFEIFGHLDPLDLLRLARTTKALRSVLMKRSALSVWKSARANVEGLPECPENVSEPAYANFMFTSHCHECLNPRATHTFSTRHVRYCKKCVENKIIRDPILQFDVMDSLPDVDGDLYPYDIIYTYFLDQEQLDASWLIRDYDKCVNLYDDFQEYPDKLEDFLQECREAVKKADERERLYRAWAERRQVERDTKLHEIRLARKTAIINRLAGLGWHEDMDKMIPRELIEFSEHPIVKQTRPLTDRIWKNIEPCMVALMRVYRDNRIKRERADIIRRRRGLFREVVDEFRKSRPFDDVIPSPADLYFMDSVLAIRQMIENSPNEVELTSADFAEFKTNLPRLCEEYKAATIPKLLEIIRRDGDLEDGEVDQTILDLAKTCFCCLRCDQSVFYPQVLTHMCLIVQPFLGDEDTGGSYEQALKALKSSPWEASLRLVYSPHQVHKTARIIRACGFDPDTATVKDLDKERIWLVHGLEMDWPELEIMDWRRAAKDTDYQCTDHWTRIRNKRLIDEIERDECAHYLHDMDEAICFCNHCRELVFSFYLISHMDGHIAENANVQQTDFYVHPDNPVDVTWWRSITPAKYRALEAGTDTF